ncbi:MAG: DNA polymerase III subunit delta [Bacteroidales bacterium]|nr:DNA polymerase III subunit delta [Bacteroidales bacterium]
MRFADIPGHEDVKARLRQMADTDRIPNALLLEGPEGTGKFALARAFAQYVHCQNRTPEGDSCGCCPSCLRHQNFNSLETIYSFPVIKKNSSSVAVSDDWVKDFREFLRANPFMGFELWNEAMEEGKQPQFYVDEAKELIRRLAFKGRSDSYKMVLMWLPERMNEPMANRLLKLIEEPFDDTRFVLVSNNSRMILPTIYSRTQRINVKAYDDETVAEILQSRGVDAQTAFEASRISEGNVIRATAIAGLDSERRQFLALFADLMRKAYARQVKDLRDWAKDVGELNREVKLRFIDYCCRLIRESFLMHLAMDSILTLTAEERNFVSRFFPFINEKNVIDIVDAFDKTRIYIAANGNSRIVLFDLALKVIMLIRRK